MLTTEQVKSKLLSYWQIEELKFIAEFHIPKNEDGSFQNVPFGFFRNLRIAEKDRTILYPKFNGLEYNRQVTFRQKLAKNLVDGRHYLIELTPEEDNKRTQNPYLLGIENVYVIDEYKPPQEFIRNWFFRKGENPEDASTIASQLKLNELELYTHTKRFIFELIQNADDMPLGNNPVNIELFLLANHLLFLHNGKYFDREDVKAISDAAKSTKGGSVTQTGYKGIGFKSVFTDSFRVYIKSGDYSFKFDKLASIYKDFWALYADYYNSKTPQAKREFEREYRGRERLFTDIDRIPWQIKPIWVNRNEFPEELIGSPFFMNQQVAIALEIGNTNFKQKNYHGMISGLMKEPRFLLFLRNTRSFTFKSIDTSESISIAIKNSRYGLEVYQYDELSASYIREDFIISIDNDEFEKAGLNFKRRELDGGKIEFYDNNGLRLENIPEKLGRLKSTVVSFAAKVIGSSIEQLSKDETILFNYLPTSDQRFEFPFLVNADFVSKTDREFIQIENKWNHYLFYHIGINCIKWIAQLGQIINENADKRFFPYAKTYLNLLPESLLDEENIEQSSINKSFNHGIKSALGEVPFILDSNGVLKRCSEIIIDETGISFILGAYFFKTISSTEKSIPHLIIDHSKLRKEYLNVDKFSALQLKENLSSVENQFFLKTIIERANQTRYDSFIKWLDEYSVNFAEEYLWFCSLPIVKLSDGAISLKDALNRSNVHIRSSKTKSIEAILEKIGYELTTFYIDDYTHLMDKVMRTESYLNKDLKLYEKLASNTNLALLNPTEKAILLTFIESLKGIGEVKFANNLPLFNTQVEQVGLKPLSSLITNRCEGLPKWLLKFVIKEEEENALPQEFRNYLIDESNILELLFCNSALFEEITTGLSSTDIESLYAYVLKLHSELPADKGLPYTGIPWLYVATLQVFQLPSAVYCPDNLLKLPVEKYKAVCLVIEGITNEYTAHSFSLPLIEKFSLGCKKGAIAKLITKSSKHSVEQSNDFLDWASTNGDNSLLEVLQFQKDDVEIAFNHVASCKAYYTSDTELISLIEDSPIAKSTLYLLPSELYDNARSKIGLMEGEQLINHLLEIGFAKPSFVTHVRKVKNEDTSRLFIAKLESIDLSSEIVYNKNSSEHLLFELIIDLGKEDDKYFDSLIDKITIDGHGLSKKNISDEVIFRFAATDTMAERRYVLKLSEILPSYKDETAALAKVIENFLDIKNSGTLKKVFKTSQKRSEDIFNELHSINLDCLLPHQIMFLLLYQEDRPKLDFKKDKPDFSEYYFEKDPIEYARLSTLFLSLMFKHKYLLFKERLFFEDLDFDNKILNENFAYEDEILPMWVKSWIADGESELKIIFLGSVGLNKDDSHVVMLRKGLEKNNLDEFQKGLVNVDSSILLRNTLSWLLKKQSEDGIKLSKSFLKDLFQKLEKRGLLSIDLPLATLINFGLDSYKLIIKGDLDSFHTINDGWKSYKQEIFSSIQQRNQFIIDDVLPSKIHRLLKSENEDVLIEPDLEKLMLKCSELTESYYLQWKAQSSYLIYIYDGDALPCKAVYSSLFSLNIKEGKVLNHEHIYFITLDEAPALPFILKDELPRKAYDDLRNLHGEFEIKKNRESSSFTYSEEEENSLKRLFGDEIPSDFHKDLNLASLIKGLIYLSSNGYDVTEAEEKLKSTHEYSQLYPVYKAGVEKEILNALKIKCRSAKTGLLYLRASSWQELENSNTYLYILTGNDNTDCRFCTTREEVIRDSKADYRVLRIEAGNGVSDIDDIIEGKFDPENLWLIIRMSDKKEYKLIFEKIRNSESSDTILNVNIGNESDD
jgi:hypothetical protein